VFIAWSAETKQVAELILEQLNREELSPWISDHIEWGAPFRREIRERILRADLVIAVFPDEPSRWQIAEAGLAYFEQKLLPVVIASDEGTAFVIEPFAELQVHSLARDDVDRGEGPSIDVLVDTVKKKLGAHGDAGWLGALARSINRLFVAGVPIVGAAVVCALLVYGLVSDESGRQLQLWRAGHIVFGAVVFGGGAFITLIFARAGVSNSFSERQFGYRIARVMFHIWLAVAVAQFFVGLVLLGESPAYSYRDGWVFIAVMAYLFSLALWYAGFDRYRAASEADREGSPMPVWTRLSLFGNLLSTIALALMTLVIVLMGLKPSLAFLG
jgi:uncharacterized membrane protein